MADIFISYAKEDRDLVMRLVAFLEAEGWTVWWDKNLGPADKFRDEIIKELAASRAVITIWTEKSIHSDWVRAEAGRAKTDGKLIPLKTSSVDYADIPLPFGEMHTEDVSKTDLVCTAVAAHLAKPRLASSLWRKSIKTFRYQALTWAGIIGGAITLFTNLGGGGIVGLADWAKALVGHWLEWNHALWMWLFAWIPVEIPRALAAPLSFSVFLLTLAIGTWLQAISATNRTYSHHVRQPVLKILNAGLIPFAGYVTVILASWVGAPSPFLVAMVAVAGMTLFYVTKISSDRLNAGIAASLLIAFYYLLMVMPTFKLISEVDALQKPSVFKMPRVGHDISLQQWIEQGEELRRESEENNQAWKRYFEIRSEIEERIRYSREVGYYSLYSWPWIVIAIVALLPSGPLRRRLGLMAVSLGLLLLLNEAGKFDLKRLLEPPKVEAPKRDAPK